MQICINECINYFVKSVIFNCTIFVPFMLYYIYFCISTFIYAFLHLFISVFLCPWKAVLTSLKAGLVKQDRYGYSCTTEDSK